MVLVRGKLIPRTQDKSQDEFREADGKAQRELFELTLLATVVSILSNILHFVQDDASIEDLILSETSVISKDSQISLVLCAHFPGWAH